MRWSSGSIKAVKAFNFTVCFYNGSNQQLRLFGPRYTPVTLTQYHAPLCSCCLPISVATAPSSSSSPFHNLHLTHVLRGQIDRSSETRRPGLSLGCDITLILLLIYKCGGRWVEEETSSDAVTFTLPLQQIHFPSNLDGHFTFHFCSACLNLDCPSIPHLEPSRLVSILSFPPHVHPSLSLLFTLLLT